MRANGENLEKIVANGEGTILSEEIVGIEGGKEGGSS